MHPEIKQDTSGTCPKCGMKLVLQKESNGYIPLIIIVSLITLVTLVLSFKDQSQGIFNLSRTISYFMIGFFLTFSGFKLIDLKGFADAYSTYDLLAKKWSFYGYIYPFIELFFGLAMILNLHSSALLQMEVLIMGSSGLGVLAKLAKKEKFQCACLGTFLKVPLTKITLIEDFGMALLAGILLVIQ